ncbi:hypothetical protein BX666DRAFT_2153616 [Dichotomocladium elegans]|nr:hypothetical protein BX666DRAFT_2153616 [Dichotomocladium elegans]
MFWSSNTFKHSDVPDLTGKIAIITGSNTGIGKACACEMAQKNCTVIIAARNGEKSSAAVEEIKAKTGNTKVDYIRLDLGSLRIIKQFADTFAQKYKRLHILVNNAVFLSPSFTTTEDGLEGQFGINHVGHYYLTILLLPLLQESAPSRIVNVSSTVHQVTTFTGINYNTLHNKNTPYHRMVVYGKSKAANILFTRELAKRLKAKGIEEVYVNTNHPGNVKTESSQSLMGFLARLVLVSPQVGNLTHLYLATSPEIEQRHITGQYYVPTAKLSTPCRFCQSDANAKELWDYTENLLKEKIPEYQGSPV